MLLASQPGGIGSARAGADRSKVNATAPSRTLYRRELTGECIDVLPFPGRSLRCRIAAVEAITALGAPDAWLVGGPRGADQGHCGHPAASMVRWSHRFRVVQTFPTE